MEFHTPNQNAAWQLEVIFNLAFAALWNNGEVLLHMGRRGLQNPIDGIVDAMRVISSTILRGGLISWCTLVMNQVTEES